MADWRRFYGASFGDSLAHRNGWTWAETVACFLELLHNPESALARVTNGDVPPWKTGDYLASDLWSALTGQAHPGRPRKGRQVVNDPTRAAARDRALDRKRDRARRIEAGELA